MSKVLATEAGVVWTVEGGMVGARGTAEVGQSVGRSNAAVSSLMRATLG